MTLCKKLNIFYMLNIQIRLFFMSQTSDRVHFFESVYYIIIIFIINIYRERESWVPRAG